MLPAEQVEREIIGYFLKLHALSQRHDTGERSTIAAKAQQHAAALICLMEEGLIDQRGAINSD